jgi:4-hydroxybenzoate polyprenyltransferase
VKKWMIYLNERSPLAALGLLSMGMALYPMALRWSFDKLMLIAIYLVGLLLLIVMRMGDELKDYETDKIVNPTRPLPRGLISVKEMSLALYGLYSLLILTGIALFFTKGAEGAIALISTVLFAYLMYKEFYMKSALDKSPLFYAFTHQLIVLPLYMWGGLSFDSTLLADKAFLFWALANFGASFTFEICRKLNPDAHKLANTYAHHYGRPTTAVVASFFIALATLATYPLGLHYITIPLAFILFATLFKWIKAPQSFKKVEGLTILLSLACLWGPIIRLFILKWSH